MAENHSGKNIKQGLKQDSKLINTQACGITDDKRDDIHVVPSFEVHISSVACHCFPELNYTDEFTGKRVFVHKVIQ